MGELIRAIYSPAEVQWIIYLLIANIVLGVVASIRAKDFQFAKLADWLGGRVAPILVGYGVAGMLAYARADAVPIQQIASYVLIGTLGGYVLANLSDIFGVKLPNIFSKK